MNKKGFTLIELLVVIAIIGILSAIVLASLNAARSKGADAAVKANVAGIRSQAEVIYDNDADYDAVCGANGVTQDATVSRAISAADIASGGTAVCGKPGSGVATNWAVATALKTVGVYWCVDNTGAARGTQSGGSAYTAVSGAGTAALTDANDVTCN